MRPLADLPIFGSPDWYAAMASAGERLAAYPVHTIVFVHGTFAGEDALGIYHWLAPIEQQLRQSQSWTTRLKRQTKRAIDGMADDLGNYTDDYVQQFAQALQQPNIHCQRFTWSGANYHLARVVGMIQLVRTLATLTAQDSQTSPSRLLLIGHSHAGQLFALLTHFLENSTLATQLLALMTSLKTVDVVQFQCDLAQLQEVRLDVVTLGTPVRYPWGIAPNRYRLLNLINHRSEVRISGLLTTRDGDYIQQWGAEGSDLPAPTPVEADYNHRLDALLDQGQNLQKVIQHLSHKTRCWPHDHHDQAIGITRLLDYQDQAMPAAWIIPGLPHSLKTLFGHGVYTQKRAMLFNLHCWLDALYPS